MRKLTLEDTGLNSMKRIKGMFAAMVGQLLTDFYCHITVAIE